jgi:predicted RNA-binding Zn-ribbon protein involved in translation (DUF1610 family)
MRRKGEPTDCQNEACLKRTFRGSWRCDGCGRTLCVYCDSMRKRGDKYLCPKCMEVAK